MQVIFWKDHQKIRCSFDEAKSNRTNFFRTNEDKKNSYQVKMLNLPANNETLTRRFSK